MRKNPRRNVMDCLESFLEGLLSKGRVVLRWRPAEMVATPGAIGLLREAFEGYRLDVAGPPVAFDERAACEAGTLVMNAGWALMDRSERVEDLGRRLAMSRPPITPGEHLSADLTLRYLPHLYRRARALNGTDPLVALLAKVLREWPLSGVLAGLDEGPVSPLDFGGHEGLMMLYAERWTRHERPGWRPEGRALEYLEVVLDAAAPRGVVHG